MYILALPNPGLELKRTYLENKDISKEYVLNAFQNTAVKTHPKIIDSFNSPYEKKGGNNTEKYLLLKKESKAGSIFILIIKD